jgi:hypothetical protein
MTVIRPGSAVVLVNTPTITSTPSDTGTAFMAGLSDRGPTKTALAPTDIITSLTQFVTVYGDRQTYSSLYDAVDLFFKEGGNKVYIGRVVGPSATKGSLNLLDGSSAVSLVATAIGAGAWSANYKVAVVAGSGANYQINVTDASNNILENSGDLPDQQSAVNWSQYSSYIRITIGAAVDNPVVHAATALSAGNDDRGNITDTQWLNALNSFALILGPGQVLAPGRTSTTGLQQLINHAETNGRAALLDAINDPTVATLESNSNALTNSRFAAQPFWPWVVIPAASSGPTGSFRTVPPSAMIAGIIARNDPSLGTDTPAAGKNGISNYAVDLSQPALDDPTRTTLNNGYINVIRNINGDIENYGWRSLADPINDPNWIDFGNGRLYNDISETLNDIAENFVFDNIDGQNGVTIQSFHGALAGALLIYYQNRQLFDLDGTAATAFTVDTSASVNTLPNIAALNLKAAVGVRMAPMAEYVEIDVTKLPVAG